MTASTPSDLLGRLLSARSTAQVEAILAVLPVVSPDDYQWVSADDRSSAWQQGKLQWVPVGLDRGNGGRIKLAGEPMNPIAERMVNGMESLIELARLRELLKNPAAVMPANPRDAVLRYLGFPKMDSIERLDDDERNEMRAKIDEVRKYLSITLDHDKKSKQFSVSIRDHGMGQVPQMMRVAQHREQMSSSSRSFLAALGSWGERMQDRTRKQWAGRDTRRASSAKRIESRWRSHPSHNSVSGHHCPCGPAQPSPLVTPGRPLPSMPQS